MDAIQAAGLDRKPHADDWPLEPVGRDLAISALGEAPWGTHFCGFFASKQDLLELTVPYFRAGLEANERCVWLARPPLGVDDMTEALSRVVPDLERRCARGQMVIAPYVRWERDPGKAGGVGEVVDQFAEALSLGYSGQRSAGLVLPDDFGDWKTLVSFEKAANGLFAGHRGLGLCVYPLDVCDSTQLLDVMLSHRFALIKHQAWTLIEPSERKRATAAVEQMNTALAERTGQLQAAVTNLRVFSRWVSHDLRAPLRHVAGFADLLAQDATSPLSERGQRLLDSIRSGAARMGALIDDILAYSTAQEGTLTIEPLDIQAMAQDVWETVTRQHKGRRVHLTLGQLPQAYGDRAMIRQVLTNLLDNAVKYTGKAPEGQIEVGGGTADGESVYSVRDNGVGFDMAHRDKLFAPFERLHAASEFEGTGLGLSIARHIVTRHGGRIWAESSPGNGATFSFTLPGRS